MKIIKVNIDQIGLEIWAQQAAIHMLSLNIDQSRQIDRLQAFDRKIERYIYRQSGRQKWKNG